MQAVDDRHLLRFSSLTPPVAIAKQKRTTASMPSHCQHKIDCTPGTYLCSVVTLGSFRGSCKCKFTASQTNSNNLLGLIDADGARVLQDGLHIIIRADPDHDLMTLKDTEGHRSAASLCGVEACQEDADVTVSDLMMPRNGGA